MRTRKGHNRAPYVAPLQLPELEEGHPDLLAPGQSYDGMRFADIDLSARDLAATAFLECEFLRVTMEDTEFRGARFSESRIETAMASVFRLDRAALRDVIVSNSRLGVVEASDTQISSTLFESCKLDFLNLRQATLDNVVFRDCQIGAIDLNGCVATRVAFQDCSADSVSFGRTRLDSTDLRGLDMGGVNGLEGIRGVTLNGVQVNLLAEAFARHLGIEIEDR